MFKIFPGYDLVEAYHNWKKAHRTDDKTVSRLIRLAIALIAALTVWFLPLDNWIEGITVIQQRTLAIFLWAILMWLFEAVPAWTTSVMVVVILLFTTSNSSLVFFKNAAPEILGQTTSYKSLLHCFADPIIMLFIGGFVLAIAASKTGLDLFLARVMLKPFGKKPKWVLLGFLMVTGVFSMFLSNTATAAMMLTFMAPIIRQLPATEKGTTALALATLEEWYLVANAKLDKLTDVQMGLRQCLKVEVIPHTAFHTETDIMERLLATCSIRRVIKKRSLG